ncbi:MAG TPA: mycothiol synthase [Aeromicrobium sp.]|nr:mycothiol synthase [Aeromicrobium sp.]
MADRELLDLIGRATTADGVAPLNEAAMFALEDPSAVRQEFARVDGLLLGYAHVDANQPPQAWCVVSPANRRQGIGTELMHRFDGIDDLHVWAHGDLPGARPLGAKVGLTPTRVLLGLEWDMTAPVSEGPVPEGVSIRTFVAGQDDAAFLELNARAFANHPEQGQMTQADLDQRIASDWFDADGFFLAERDGELLGFHWTKTHTDPPVGEVYIVGVDPLAQGLGLGKLLTAHGLRHLQGRGFERVILYVEGDNERALGVYRGLGFNEAMRDVQYSRA